MKSIIFITVLRCQTRRAPKFKARLWIWRKQEHFAGWIRVEGGGVKKTKFSMTRMVLITDTGLRRPTCRPVDGICAKWEFSVEEEK